MEKFPFMLEKKIGYALSLIFFYEVETAHHARARPDVKDPDVWAYVKILEKLGCGIANDSEIQVRFHSRGNSIRKKISRFAEVILKLKKA